VIKRTHRSGVATLFAALLLVSLGARTSRAQATPAAGQAANQAPSYTLPEYNALQAAQAEKDPGTKIKLLDAFVAQYPNSTLMQYIYQLYYQAYYGLKNIPKAIEYTDKLIALGDKADAATRVTAIQARIQLFAASPDLAKNHDEVVKNRDAALLGVKLLPDVKKANPAVKDDALKTLQMNFEATAGQMDSLLKDYPAAIDAFKAQLALNPNDPLASYRMGVAELQSTPAQSLDGFWALARAVDLKVPQTEQVRDYLRKAILSYQAPNCDSLIDAQMSELLQLAANAQDRPASWSIPSAADIQKVAQSSTIITVIADLSGGGDKAKLTWLAICGAEFPEVVGKIIDVKKSDNFVDIMVFTSASSDEIAAATTANMDVKVWTAPPPAGTPGTITPQPDVARVQKDDEIRFSGTLTSYDPSPFMLHWDSAKVDPSTIPEKGGAAKRPARKTAK